MFFDRYIVRAEAALGSACLALLFSLLLINVLLRYLFDTSLFWAEELAVTLFIWMGFLAAASTEAGDGHVRLTLLVDRLSPQLRRIIDTLVDCVLLMALILLVATAHSGLATLQTTVALRLPEKWLYAIVPVTMALCALHIVIRILRRMRGLPKIGV
jgi:TRAP-type C4-dicarboxylate transport system permease small subunit